MILEKGLLYYSRSFFKDNQHSHSLLRLIIPLSSIHRKCHEPFLVIAGHDLQIQTAFGYLTEWMRLREAIRKKTSDCCWYLRDWQSKEDLKLLKREHDKTMSSKGRGVLFWAITKFIKTLMLTCTMQSIYSNNSQ